VEVDMRVFRSIVTAGSGVVVVGLLATTPVAAQQESPAIASSGHPAATCAKPVITRLVFQPRVVAEGKTATLHAVIDNCTDKAFAGSLMTFGRLVCEVLDPISRPVQVPAGGEIKLPMRYTAPDCTGQGAITGELLAENGKVLSVRVAKVKVVS
jgi:uncharacterized protein YfaS (alpha-2-macroglobulin family)